MLQEANGVQLLMKHLSSGVSPEQAHASRKRDHFDGAITEFSRRPTESLVNKIGYHHYMVTLFRIAINSKGTKRGGWQSANPVGGRSSKRVGSPLRSAFSGRRAQTGAYQKSR